MIIVCINCRQETSDLFNECLHCNLDPCQLSVKEPVFATAEDFLNAKFAIRPTGPEMLLMSGDKVICPVPVTTL
jgi:hypothetical protein